MSDVTKCFACVDCSKELGVSHDRLRGLEALHARWPGVDTPELLGSL